MTDDQLLLASAYLDGELTAEDRARAEADPVVLGAVEELRVLRGRVRDVEPAAAAVREDAIATALAASTAPTRAAAVAATDGHDRSPVPVRSRPAARGVLAVAAGLLAVGLLGVAVANLTTGSDDSDESAIELSASSEARVAADDGDSAEELATAEVAAADEADDAAGAATAESVVRPATVPPSPEFGQVLTSPEELGAFGAVLLDARDGGTLPPTPNHACDYYHVLATVTYVDPSEPDGVEQDLLVEVDESDGLVLGIDPDTCRPVVESRLPDR